MRRLLGSFLVLGLAALAFGGPAAGPRYAAPDLLYFEKSIAADLHERCAGCHSDPEMGAGYSLAPLDDIERPDPAILLKNFRATLKHLDPERPDESALLRKVLGGGGHPELYRSRTTRDYERLQHFAMGATTKNRPPEAIVQKRYDARVGQKVEIDGTLSADPDGSAIRYG